MDSSNDGLTGVVFSGTGRWREREGGGVFEAGAGSVLGQTFDSGVTHMDT